MLSALFLACLLSGVVYGDRPSFDIGFLAPLSGRIGIGSNWVGAFLTAIQMFNEDPASNVTLVGHVLDSGLGNATIAQQAAAELIGRGVEAVLEPGIDFLDQAAAQMLSAAKIPHISYVSAPSVLANYTTKPYYFSMVALPTYQGTGLATVVAGYGWNSSATMAFGDGAAARASAYEAAYTGMGRTVSASLRFPMNASVEQIVAGLGGLRNGTTRVVVIFASFWDSDDVVRALLQQGMLGGDWMYLTDQGLPTPGPYLPSPMEQQGMQGFVGLQPATGAGEDWENFLGWWIYAQPSTYPYLHPSRFARPIDYAAQIRDAVEAVYIAVSELAPMLNTSLNDTHLNTTRVREALRDIDADHPFNGALGIVYFDDTHTVPASYDIVNYQGSLWQTVGQWHADSGLAIQSVTLFPGGRITPPPDTVLPSTSPSASASALPASPSPTPSALGASSSPTRSQAITGNFSATASPSTSAAAPAPAPPPSEQQEIGVNKVQYAKVAGSLAAFVVGFVGVFALLIYCCIRERRGHPLCGRPADSVIAEAGTEMTTRRAPAASAKRPPPPKDSDSAEKDHEPEKRSGDSSEDSVAKPSGVRPTLSATGQARPTPAFPKAAPRPTPKAAPPAETPREANNPFDPHNPFASPAATPTTGPPRFPPAPAAKAGSKFRPLPPTAGGLGQVPSTLRLDAGGEDSP